MPAEWTDAEIESLSAYIDGQLEESDRAALEARLANDADLRQELAVMRQTVALLRDLPTIRAPRAFTLTPEMVGQTAVPAAAHAELRVLPAAKKARPAQRVWGMPAASAAAVVLLAGVFVVMQTNMSSQTPPTGAVQQDVAVLSTPTTITSFSELNTVVQESVTQTELLKATNEDTDQSDGTIDEEDDTAPVGAAGGQAEQETSLVLATQGQDQGTLTQVGAMVPVAPPIEVQNQVSATQIDPPAPVLQVVVSTETSQGEPRFVASQTPMPTNTIELLDAMVLPLATQMPLSTQMPMVTASPDPKLLPSYGGANAPAETGVGGEPANPEAVAGMDGINTNPEASGFTVATVSPLQGTAIAQYNSRLEDAQTAAETPAAASSVMQDAPSDVLRSPKDPIWIRWFNVISAWVEQLLGE